MNVTPIENTTSPGLAYTPIFSVKTQSPSEESLYRHHHRGRGGKHGGTRAAPSRRTGTRNARGLLKVYRYPIHPVLSSKRQFRPRLISGNQLSVAGNRGNATYRRYNNRRQLPLQVQRYISRAPNNVYRRRRTSSTFPARRYAH